VLLSALITDKISDIKSLKKERFILAHGFREFNPGLLGSVDSRLCLSSVAEHHGSRSMWAKRMFTPRSRGKKRPEASLSYLLPRPRPHFPMFSEPLKIEPPDQTLIQHTSLWGTFHIQTITACLYKL
jgi:hypothetical protein